MGDIQTRPFSKNYRLVLLSPPPFSHDDSKYSGLINQSVIAIGISIICVAGHEIMKRRRRGKHCASNLGSRESWEFGYLFQARSWARRASVSSQEFQDNRMIRHPSQPCPTGWPLSWVKEVARFPESKLNELCGVDAALYTRFLRGCFWFALLHSMTTFPVLFPIHLRFAEMSISPESMTRASISSLVGTTTGLSLLWIHILLLFWITFTWITTLCWISLGAFQLRQAHLCAIAKNLSMVRSSDGTLALSPHPHPPYTFVDTSPLDAGYPNIGLRSRTVMVSNIPHPLRNEKALEEYFTYYMSQKLEKPSMGFTSSIQPGLLDKCCAFLINRLRNRAAYAPPNHGTSSCEIVPRTSSGGDKKANHHSAKVPLVERVIIGRKMRELAALVERREETLTQLEAAHVKLANKVLLSARAGLDKRSYGATGPTRHPNTEVEYSTCSNPDNDEGHLDHLVATLGPFVQEFGLHKPPAWPVFSQPLGYLTRPFRPQRPNCPDLSDQDTVFSSNEASHPQNPRPQNTVWDALITIPRSSLNMYQPRIRLRYHRFREESVSEIDYFTAKLDVLNSRIRSYREKALNQYEPVSTAFVTFSDHAEARKACKFLAAHPSNPLACLVTMAPAYEDLDWMSVMKPSFDAEFLKDWVVNIGVWGFTLSWLFPVSLLVGLVSIQNISRFWPSLKAYLDRHAWQEEIIQSFLPTILVSILALLIPVILFLIAKKAHTVKTLSALHDLILTRYYKFLVVNVLVFFCIGTAALQSFLLSFKSSTRPNLLQIVADSFSSAGPFYVGWLIFSTAIHGFLELALVGLPLFSYPSTARETTPRKRAVGIRPRTFTYYYWIPNHLLALHVLLLFSVLNPFVLPFGALYFFVQTGIIKNQFIHVYARNYEGNGEVILIRLVRYSLDGLILAQAVFLAYMVVLKKPANVGLSAFLIVVTTLAKIVLTRICRAQFEAQDTEEAELVSGLQREKRDELGGNLRTLSNEGGNDAMRDTQVAGTVQVYNRPSWIEFSSRSLQNWLRFEQQNYAPSNTTDFSQLFSTTSHSNARQVLVPQQIEPTHVSNVSSHATLEAFVEDYPVVPRPPPDLWDDQTMVNRPYDNPFYTRELDRILWLPRNPCGILDLDDTVGLRTSLTENLTTGRDLDMQMPNESSACGDQQLRDGIEPLIRITGSTSPHVCPVEAELSEGVPSRALSRVNAEQATRPTIFEGPSFLRGRSLSEGEGARTLRLSQGVPFNLKQIFRTRSSDIELGMVRSRTEVEGASPTTLHARNISTHEAIFQKVLVEEEEALKNHLEGEKSEELKAKAAAKSWLTSWMFQRAVE